MCRPACHPEAARARLSPDDRRGWGRSSVGPRRRAAVAGVRHVPPLPVKGSWSPWPRSPVRPKTRHGAHSGGRRVGAFVGGHPDIASAGATDRALRAWSCPASVDCSNARRALSLNPRRCRHLGPVRAYGPGRRQPHRRRHGVPPRRFVGLVSLAAGQGPPGRWVSAPPAGPVVRGQPLWARSPESAWRIVFGSAVDRVARRLKRAGTSCALRDDRGDEDGGATTAPCPARQRSSPGSG